MSSAQHDTRAELAELLKRRNELTVRLLIRIFADQSTIIAYGGHYLEQSSQPLAGEFGQLGAANLRV